MREASYAVLLLGIALPALGQELGSNAGSDVIRTAQAVLEKSAEAYRKAPGFADVMTVETQMPGGEAQTGVIEFGFGAGTDAYYKRMGTTFIALGDRLFVTADRAKDQYVDVPLQGDLGSTRNELLGDDSLLPVQFAMRAGRGIEASVKAFGFDILEQPHIAGYRIMRDDNDRAMYEISIAADNGRALVRIDGATYFVIATTIELMSQEPEEGKFTAKIRFDPRVVEDVRGLIKFDPAGREPITSLRELERWPIRPGDEAVDFSLQTLDGKVVTLSRLRGSVVVLEFWATWCGPCREGLRHLQEFAEWVEASDLPVEVYPLNVLERASSNDAWRAKVAWFWKSQGLSMTTLLDLDGTVAAGYGSPSLPRTFVIGPNGKVVFVHHGSHPNLNADLQKQVQQILTECEPEEPRAGRPRRPASDPH